MIEGLRQGLKDDGVTVSISKLEASKNGILDFLRAAAPPSVWRERFCDVDLASFRGVSRAPSVAGLTQPRIFLSAR